VPVTKKFSLEKMQLPDLEQIPIKIRRKAVRAGTKIVALRTRETAPDSGRAHKGKLRKSIRYQVRKGGREGVIQVKNRIAHIVHDGAKGHWIRSKYGRFMAFRLRGRLVIARAIWHPGVRPNPFLTRAMEEKLPQVVDAMRKTAEEGIAEALK
jgi:HK97 gp10 family phage protein